MSLAITLKSFLSHRAHFHRQIPLHRFHLLSDFSENAVCQIVYTNKAQHAFGEIRKGAITHAVREIQKRAIICRDVLS